MEDAAGVEEDLKNKIAVEGKAGAGVEEDLKNSAVEDETGGEKK